MAHIFGEYEVAVDTKGRVLLPAALRKQFAPGTGEKFVVNRGVEKCVTIYTVEAWTPLFEKIANLDDFSEEDRTFKRLFLNGATPVELDTADRLLVPKQLQEYAGIRIQHDAVISGQGNKLELWDKEAYYRYMNGNADKYNELSEKVGKTLKNKGENKPQ
jgi:MraZ protein